MKKATKLTALLMALAMVLGLAACGKNGGESGNEGKVKLVIGVPGSDHRK